MHANPLAIPTIVGAVALFWAGLTQTKLSRFWLWIGGLATAVPGMLFVLYYTHVLDNAAWLYNLRSVPYIELAGCGLGFVAGMVHSWWQPEGLGEKLVVPAILFVLAAVPFIKPLLDPLDESQLKERYDGDVCLQSTFSTCGPASAVTLLRSFGENTTEKQFARECFTSRGGTEVWYIARALRRRGFSTRVVIRSPGIDEFPAPAIAGVVLPGAVGHFIAILASNESSVTLADPLKGKIVLSRRDVQKQYRFTGFFLVVNSRYK